MSGNYYNTNRKKTDYAYQDRSCKEIREKIVGQKHAFAGQICKITFQVVLIMISVYMISNGTMSAETVITVYYFFQKVVKLIDEVYRLIDEVSLSVVKVKALLELTSCDPEEGKVVAWYENPELSSLCKETLSNVVKAVFEYILQLLLQNGSTDK